MVRGAAHCHGRGVAHRDLKLDNALLFPAAAHAAAGGGGACGGGAAVLKLIDFGMSAVVDRAAKFRLQCGTPAYAGARPRRPRPPPRLGATRKREAGGRREKEATGRRRRRLIRVSRARRWACPIQRPIAGPGRFGGRSPGRDPSHSLGAGDASGATFGVGVPGRRRRSRSRRLGRAGSGDAGGRAGSESTASFPVARARARAYVRTRGWRGGGGGGGVPHATHGIPADSRLDLIINHGVSDPQPRSYRPAATAV